MIGVRTLARRGVFPIFASAAMIAVVGSRVSTQEVTAEVSFLQIEHRRIAEAVHEDVDGDGLRDLVLATSDLDDPSRRWLQVHLNRAAEPPFVREPDRTVDVVRDVVAFAIADVHSNPGREIVLFSPSIAVGVFFEGEDGEPSLFRIAPIRLLWQPARQAQTIDLQKFVVDIDGDGKDDLVVPEPDGYRVIIQRPGEDGAPAFESAALTVPPRRAGVREEGQARLQAQADTLRMRMREDDRDRVFTLLDCREQTPAPVIVDWEGDGDRDVVAFVEREICVWPYDVGFDSDPTVRGTLPPFQASVLNPSNFVVVADVNVDGRKDVVFVAGRVKGDEVVGHVEIYLQEDGGAIAAKPADRLMLQGFVDVPRIQDVNDDGRPELVIGSLRPDLIGTISAGGSGSIDGQVNVFHNEFESSGGRFGRPVAMVEKLELSGDVLRSRFRDRAVAAFLFDFDGDGVREFLQRTRPKKLALRATVASGARYRLGDVLWNMNVNADSRVIPFVETDHVALVIVERAQVVFVRLR